MTSTFQDHQLLMAKVKTLLDRLNQTGTPKQYLLFFQKYHEADIAEALADYPLDFRAAFFRKVKPELGVDVLEEMVIEQQAALIGELKIDLAAEYIEEMQPDDAVDLLEELLETDEDRVEEIIDALPAEDAADINKLLSYSEDTAGAIMTPEYLAIPNNLTVGEALRRIKRRELPRSEVSFYIYIVNKQKKLVGYTTLRDLILAKINEPIKNVQHDVPKSVYVDMDQEDVVRMIRKYDITVLPVLDKDNKLVGIITVDDIVDVVFEEATEDIYLLSGTQDISQVKLISGRIYDAVRARSPWLIVTIFGGFVASFVINFYSHIYQPKLFSLALSLSFMPLLMGLGGNVGNQSATIIVRGIATGVIKLDKAYRYLFREVFVGFCIGGLVAAIVFLFNLLMSSPLSFSIIVSVALWLNMVVAAFIGTALPILFQKINIDPAIASAPFISTALDVVGQVIYFALTILVIVLV